MAHSKHNLGHSKTEVEKAIQRRRTHSNKVRKYEKMIKDNPNHKDISAWQTKLDYSKERK